MTYDVTIDRDAAKQLARIHPTHAARILAAITVLADNPRPPGAIQLRRAAACPRRPHGLVASREPQTAGPP
jgi:mRNA-degrading endonuclease RelE of RelBE toxin-antitoxin system